MNGSRLNIGGICAFSYNGKAEIVSNKEILKNIALVMTPSCHYVRVVLLLSWLLKQARIPTII